MVRVDIDIDSDSDNTGATTASTPQAATVNKIPPGYCLAVQSFDPVSF